MTLVAVNKVNRGISLPAGARKLLDSNDNLQSACHFHAMKYALHVRDLSTHITRACVLHMQIQVGLPFTCKHRILYALSLLSVAQLSCFFIHVLSRQTGPVHSKQTEELEVFKLAKNCTPFKNRVTHFHLTPRLRMSRAGRRRPYTPSMCGTEWSTRTVSAKFLPGSVHYTTALCYPMLPKFRKSFSFWKVCRFCIVVLLVRSTCWWKWVWSVGGMVLRGETEVLEEKSLTYSLR